MISLVVHNWNDIKLIMIMNLILIKCFKGMNDKLYELCFLALIKLFLLMNLTNKVTSWQQQSYLSQDIWLVQHLFRLSIR